MKIYHILNGDSLKAQFPKTIEGEIIVARECLIDGDVSGNDLNRFFKNRASFIESAYGDSINSYYENTVSEFQRILSIPKNSTINLWFEEDVFCQVNFWFTINLLHQNQQTNLFLIRPNKGNEYSFVALSESDLQNVFKHRTKIIEIEKISRLWPFYQQNDITLLLKTAQELSKTHPFILNAVNAYIASLPTEKDVGQPTNIILQIINELQTDNFGKIFQAFCQRAAIYGYGDLQVKRLFDAIKDKKMTIQNSTLQDIDTIFDLYEKATNYQKIKFPDNEWPKFERAMVEKEIKENCQWNLTIDGQIACVWATTFSDPKIWEERNIDPSVYIHRIATNPNFRGQNFVQKIVDWTKIYAKSNQKQFVRLDTCGHNQGLINHYCKSGFEFLGIWKLQDSEGLPPHYIDAEVCFFEINLDGNN